MPGVIQIWLVIPDRCSTTSHCTLSPLTRAQVPRSYRPSSNSTRNLLESPRRPNVPATRLDIPFAAISRLLLSPRRGLGASVELREQPGPLAVVQELSPEATAHPLVKALGEVIQQVGVAGVECGD